MKRIPVVLTIAYLVALSLCGAQAGRSAHGQAITPASVQESPSFEVASIKPGKPGFDQVRVQFTADGISAENTPPLVLIEIALGAKENEIVGLPNWAKADNFDIQAKVSPTEGDLRNLPFDQRKKMIVSLLADRFKLKFHHENREGPVYELVVAKGGPKFNEIEEASPHDAISPQANLEKEKKPSMLFVGTGEIVAHSISISSFVSALSGLNLGRPIIDKTNLTGKYDFKLQWTPDIAVESNVREAANDSRAIDPSPNLFPPLFTALQEQLGLKLESRRGSVDAIVIDSLDKPSPN